jgi:hypothetical protein
MNDPEHRKRDIFDKATLAANIVIAVGGSIAAVGAVVAACYTAGLWHLSSINSQPQLSVTAEMVDIKGGQYPAFKVQNDGDYPAENISIACRYRKPSDPPSFPVITERSSEAIHRLGRGNAREFYVISCTHTSRLSLSQGDELLVYLCYGSISGTHEPPDRWIFRLVGVGPNRFPFSDFSGIEHDDFIDEYFASLDNGPMCPAWEPPPTVQPLTP